ncbi:Ser-Thr-rich glycosyl-phosphatidyl-inositol-anchored membrane family-domain-containing protein [Penicillium malachiteum]|uniref:Ser-Thr-rich glycosyl-phosphatidyl-inositol-anchored membrane family-domain-containing protein n=1 Tax=Penicillium malachiteum TaxID=1324776 RepID=UPI002548A00B|nr:Ser-Thr-rich glycosyl-phosphatidyl-inositol-anchored membrane family-domain-containing protein [Penicillium malachiteum]KAJ5713799.1 Ser-Thr-rich glycosyl-phosphatidyl-inositol-anchored membrane family-domain-containing protein [Penicillium malachiteum]
MRFSTATVFSALVAFASAYTTPDYSEDPTGNPILTPGLQQQVPEGKPFEITWTPTTPTDGKISLVLLQGLSTDMQVLYAIAEDIPNSGSYTWTPSTSLTPQTTHYGLLLVVEATGQYQYSTQFGIVSDGTVSSSSSAVTLAQTTAQASATGTVVTVIDNETTTICPETETASPTPTAWTTIRKSTEITTTICPETETNSVPAATNTIVASGSLTRRPTKPTTTPAGSGAVVPSGTSSPSASATPYYNGAGQNTISFGAIVAAMFAVMAF